MKNLFNSIIASVFFVLVWNTNSEAQIPGTIDSTFGNNGTLFFTDGYGFSVGKDAIALPDDRILMAGIMETASLSWDAAVLRFMPDGSIDSSFGVNGSTIFDVSGDLDFIYKMALQDDGKIVVCGGGLVTPADIRIFVARVNPDGGVDSTFGVNGISWLMTDGGEDLANSLAITHDGKIIIAGQNSLAGFTYTDPIVARFTADGVVDSTFGTDGSTTIDVDYNYSQFYDVLAQDDGSSIAVGYVGNNHYDILVEKFTSAGKLDSSFATNGTAIFNLNTGDDEAFSIIRHPLDGRILIGGRKGNGNNKTDFLVMSIDANGKIDSTFGVDGQTVFSAGAQEAIIDMSVQSNGKIVGCGASGGTGIGSNNWAVCRLLENGGLDYDFGTDSGLTVSVVTDFFSEADGMTIQSTGRIITVGNAGFSTGNQFGVVAYRGDDVATGVTPVITNITMSNVMIYPNPSSGQFTLLIKTDIAISAIANIQIVNTIGQVMLSTKAPVMNGMVKEGIDLTGKLTSGTYFVKTQIGNSVYTRELTYQK